MKKPVALLVSFILVLSFLQIDCKKDTVSTPTENTPDTTSHNFAFTTYTFGGSGGSSYFKDVAIINDSDIWAVGGIFTSPDTSYNAAHWNGKKWELEKITNVVLNSVFAFSSNNVWAGSSAPYHWDGVSWQVGNVVGIFNGNIYKFWGASSQNLFMVGTNGSIAHFDGLMWTKQESGTTIDLRDIWGSADGKTVWACGYSNDNSGSILLKNDGAGWKTVWDVSKGKQPYGDVLTSLWGEKNLFASSNIGVYKQSFVEIDTAKQTLSLNHFPYRIKGSAENNIAVVGDFGMIWHYNGSTWKSIYLTTSGHPLYSVAVLKNMIVAVGSDYDIGFGAGLIYLGKR